MKKKVVVRLIFLLAAAAVLLYLGVWRMARHGPGPGDTVWQDLVEKRGWARSASIGGAELYWLEAGSGPAVLFIHGYADSSYTWRRQIEPLSAAGFRVLAVDLPGMGRSEAPPGFDYTPPTFSAVLLDWLDHIGVQRADVAGNSLGGSLALYLAAHHPESVRRLAPVDPAAYDSGRHTLYRIIRRYPPLAAAVKPLIGPWALQFGVRQAFHDPDLADAELVSQMAQPFKRGDYARRLLEIGAGYFGPAYQSLPEKYDGIKAPALIIWGENDKLIPVRPSGPDLNAALPDSILVVLEKTGHLPQQEKPDEFNRLLIDFLK